MCPECGEHQWRTTQDPANFRLKLLLCNACGFSVDTRVVIRARRIRAQNHGLDSIASEQDKSEDV